MWYATPPIRPDYLGDQISKTPNPPSHPPTTIPHLNVMFSI